MDHKLGRVSNVYKILLMGKQRFELGDSNDRQHNMKQLEVIQVLFINSGLLQHHLLFPLIHAIPHAIHHRHTRVFLEAFSMSDKKIPIQAVKWAGHIAVTVLPIVFTRFTVITHGVDVFG